VGASQVQQISSVISLWQQMQNRKRSRFFATATWPRVWAALSDGVGAL
jgi:hypothetical protein